MQLLDFSADLARSNDQHTQLAERYEGITHLASGM